jgi:hypothetical protein
VSRVTVGSARGEEWAVGRVLRYRHRYRYRYREERDICRYWGMFGREW